MHLSKIARTLAPSITLELDARAKALAAAGRDVINMSVGEPDFPAPPTVRAAAVEKVQGGDVRYTPAAGLLSLREALAQHLTTTRGLAFDPTRVAVCHSAKHALTVSLLATVNEGDEVLIPLPAWSSYFEEVRVAGGKAVLVPPTADCRPDLDALEAAVTERSRLIIINSPSNPSGYVLDEGELERIVTVAKRHELWILSDEIYRRLVYDGASAPSPASLGADGSERTIIVDGASKCFAMTGYRIGFAAGPEPLIRAISALNSQMTGSPNAVSQCAYEAALRNDPPETEKMRVAFGKRRDVLLAGLRELGLESPEPRGAFYAFPGVARYLDERGSVGFCADLLESQGLAIVPGAAFGVDDHVRLSYATDEANIREALKRLGGFLTGKDAQPNQPARSTNQ